MLVQPRLGPRYRRPKAERPYNSLIIKTYVLPRPTSPGITPVRAALPQRPPGPTYEDAAGPYSGPRGVGRFHQPGLQQALEVRALRGR